MWDLSIRSETIKHLEENRGKKLLDICLDNSFWDMTSKAIATKAKINKRKLIKLKNFCTTKQTINKIKKQPEEREKMFVNHLTQGFYPEYIRNV